MVQWLTLRAYCHPYVDRMWCIWGSFYDLPKAMFYLLQGGVDMFRFSIWGLGIRSAAISGVAGLPGLFRVQGIWEQATRVQNVRHLKSKPVEMIAVQGLGLGDPVP